MKRVVKYASEHRGGALSVHDIHTISKELELLKVPSFVCPVITIFSDHPNAKRGAIKSVEIIDSAR